MKLVFQLLISWIKKTFPPADKILGYNLYVLGYAGLFGHPIYYIIWRFLDPQPYENLILRLSACLVSLVLLTHKFWPVHLQKYLSTYWFFAVAYNLPFLFTSYFILNDFSIHWSCAMMAAIFFTVMLLPNPIALLLNLATGSLAAFLYASAACHETLKFDQHFFITYIPLFGFALVVGYAFSFSNFLGAASEERSRLLKSLSGSIAHELRNPLNNIAQIKSEIAELITHEIKNLDDVAKLKSELKELNSHARDAIDTANNTIDMILADLDEKPILPSDFAYLRPAKILPEIIKKYGYKSNAEKLKVKLDPSLLQDLARDLVSRNNSLPFAGQEFNNSPLEGQGFNNSPLEGESKLQSNFGGGSITMPVKSSLQINKALSDPSPNQDSPSSTLPQGEGYNTELRFNNSPLEGFGDSSEGFNSPLEGESMKPSYSLVESVGGQNLATKSSSQSNSALLTPHGSKDLTAVKSFSPAPPQGGSCVSQPNLSQNFQSQGEGLTNQSCLTTTTPPQGGSWVSHSNCQSPLGSNFFFKAVPPRFDFIMFNLIKNALYYTSQFPASEVILGAEEREIDGKIFNSIFVLDFGPGVPKDVMPKLFDDFFTSGKSGGTGLGLAFCKRNMQIFGGDIICESKQVLKNSEKSENGQAKIFSSSACNLGEVKFREVNLEQYGQKVDSNWTKFSAIFPKLGDEEASKAKLLEAEFLKQLAATKDDEKNRAKILSCEAQKPRRILIVDDEKTNLVINKSKIEKFLKNTVCDTAQSGAVAYKMFEESFKFGNPYELILMDIQMPDQDGAYTTRKIREFLTSHPKKDATEIESELPIISFTSLDFKSFNSYAISAKARFSDYINKSASNHIFCRSIAKWLINFKDDFLYLEDGALLAKNSFEALKNKEVMLVDDQELNRKIFKRSLEKYGMKVIEATNGFEMVENYEKSLIENTDPTCSQTKISKFDLIITDINMPHMNGKDATKRIREIESEHYTKRQKRLPIIAFSGDSSKREVFGFFESQITDYFTKGNDVDLLIKIALNYLKDDEGKKEAVCEDHYSNISSAKNEEDILEDAKINKNEVYLKPNLTKDQEMSELEAGKSNQDFSKILSNGDFDQKITQEKQQNNEFTALKICNHSKIDFFEKSERAELIELYLTDSADKIAKIHEGAAENDLQKISFNIHALKGISANIGADKLVALIRKIEPYFKGNQTPPEKDWLNWVEELYKELLRDLNELN